jgi:outer membrane protein assembly factor BamB
VGLDVRDGKALWSRSFVKQSRMARVQGADTADDILALNVTDLIDYRNMGLVILDANTGKELLKIARLLGRVRGMAPVVHQGRILSFSRIMKDALFVFDAETGTNLVKRVQPSSEPFQSPPVVLADSNIAFVAGNKLTLIDGGTGKLLWEHGMGKAHANTMKSDGTWIADIADPARRSSFAVTGTLNLFDPANRNRRWATKLNYDRGYDIHSIGSDHIFLIEKNYDSDDPSTSLAAYSLADGRLAWKQFLMDRDGTVVEAMIGKDRGVAVVSTFENQKITGLFIIFDARSGVRLKTIRFETPFRYKPSSTVVDGVLVFSQSGVIEGWGKGE